MDALIWFLMIETLGFVVLPIIHPICSSLADKGYSISKILGILLITYLAWNLSYVSAYNLNTIWFSFLILFAISLVLIRIRGIPRVSLSLVLWNEAVFTTVFLIFLFIRVYNPDIAMPGEKPMDFAILNAIFRDTSFPPNDPWMAGRSLDFYYYYGYLIIATLAKLSGISSSIAYNLGMVTLASLSANAVFGIGYSLTKSPRHALATMILVVFLANLVGAFQLGANLLGIRETSYGTTPDLLNYWPATRVIPYTINEFPFFSFIFGDLHPHVMSIPFQLLIIALLLSIHSSKRIGFSQLLALALALGSLFPLNSWDYPTYLILSIIVLSLQQFREVREGRKIIRNMLFLGPGLLGLSIGFFTLFYLDFKGSGFLGIGIVEDRTDIGSFLIIFILFIFLIYSLLFLERDPYPPLILAALIAPIALVIGFQTLILLVPLLLLSAGNSCELFVHRGPIDSKELTGVPTKSEHCDVTLTNVNGSSDDSQNAVATPRKSVGCSLSSKFVSILIFLGTFLALFCEILYIDDYFGKPLERMNTVFKLYMQLWLLWGIAAGYGLFVLSPKVFNSRNLYKIWISLFLLIIVSSGVYPFILVYARTGGFSGKPTLDGVEFMKKEYHPDYDAIYWINKNINGIPVILEAPGNSYTSTSRISSYTGLPTIIGWWGHEVQWRNGWEEPLLRVNDANKIYDSKDPEEAMILLKKYNVSYVYLGDIELKRYSAQGLRKFEDPSRFELVYRGVAEIYRVKYD